MVQQGRVGQTSVPMRFCATERARRRCRVRRPNITNAEVYFAMAWPAAVVRKVGLGIGSACVF
jgi:hypothetical protein